MPNPPPDLEHKKWTYEQNRAVAERAHDAQRKFTHVTNKAAIEASNHALRALILINGGAAIAMLAFIGNFVSNNQREVADICELRWTIPILFTDSNSAQFLSLSPKLMSNCEELGEWRVDFMEKIRILAEIW